MGLLIRPWQAWRRPPAPAGTVASTASSPLRRSSSGSLASACNFVKAQSMSSMQKDVTVAMRPDRHRTVLSEPECRADRRLLPPAGARLSV